MRQEIIEQQRELIAGQKVLLDEALARLGIALEPEPKPKRPQLRVVGSDG